MTGPAEKKRRNPRNSFVKKPPGSLPDAQISLVLFSGTSFVQLPLTSDFDDDLVNATFTANVDIFKHTPDLPLLPDSPTLIFIKHDSGGVLRGCALMSLFLLL